LRDFSVAFIARFKVSLMLIMYEVINGVMVSFKATFTAPTKFIFDFITITF